MEFPAEQTVINGQTLEETSQRMTDAFPFRSACTDLALSPGREFPWHWHNEVEILMLISGKLDFLTTSCFLTLSEGDIVFLPGGMLHCTRALDGLPAGHKEYIFSPLLIAGAPGSEIDRKYVSPVLRACSEPVLLPAGTPENRAAAPLLEEAFEAYITGEDGYELRIRRSMDGIWMLLRKQILGKLPQGSRLRSGEERLKSVLLFLQENYGSSLTVADMAVAVNISERECSRCFKKQLGITPMDYLLNLRLSKACAMLDNTGLSVGEIASACGFSSSSYFSKQFRDRFSLTPRAYRTRDL